jgi:hypothetical protein
MSKHNFKGVFALKNLGRLTFLLLIVILLTGFVLPAFALEYNAGVTVGQYVKYGNFAGVGPGVEAFNDYDWLRLQVTAVSGKAVTLLSTSQYKNGAAIPGNGSISVWNVEAGTEDGLPSTQGPLVAANLNQGDAIPPPNTYAVNRTENRVYLGVVRTVNLLDVTLSTSDYNTSLNYVYDRASGMLLESKTQTTNQAQPQPVTTTISYSIIETNLFASTSTTPTPSPSIPEFQSWIILPALLVVATMTAAYTGVKRKRD